MSFWYFLLMLLICTGGTVAGYLAGLSNRHEHSWVLEAEDLTHIMATGQVPRKGAMFSLAHCQFCPSTIEYIYEPTTTGEPS